MGSPRVLTKQELWCSQLSRSHLHRSKRRKVGALEPENLFSYLTTSPHSKPRPPARGFRPQALPGSPQLIRLCVSGLSRFWLYWWCRLRFRLYFHGPIPPYSLSPYTIFIAAFVMIPLPVFTQTCLYHSDSFCYSLPWQLLLLRSRCAYLLCRSPLCLSAFRPLHRSLIYSTAGPQY